MKKGLGYHPTASRLRGDGTGNGPAGDSNPATPSLVANCLRAIGARESKVRMGGSYCMINFGNSDGGHAVSAWVAQDALFFDPNNGEYWFENYRDFCNWFPMYFRLAGYAGWPCNFTKRWGVEEYGVKMGSTAMPTRARR